MTLSLEHTLAHQTLTRFIAPYTHCLDCIQLRVHSAEKCPSGDQIAHLLSGAAKYRVTHQFDSYILLTSVSDVSLACLGSH